MSASTVTVELLSAEEFTQALRGLEHRYWGTHPFHRRLHDGDLDERELRIWAANRWYYQSMIPQKDAAIISNCPLPDVRRAWLQRIIYHDGPAHEGPRATVRASRNRSRWAGRRRRAGSSAGCGFVKPSDWPAKRCSTSGIWRRARSSRLMPT